MNRSRYNEYFKMYKTKHDYMLSILLRLHDIFLVVSEKGRDKTSSHKKNQNGVGMKPTR